MLGQLREFTIKKITANSESIETVLIDNIISGDQEAFETFYKLYYDRLARFVFRTAGNLVSIEEVINDVMLVVWEKADTYDRKCKLSTWIFGIAYNKIKKSLAKQNAILEDSIEEELDVEYFPLNTDVIQQIEEQDWLETAFEALSPNQRVVFELTYFNGMHYEEIANLMGCPENTIKTRMFHARKKISEELKRLA